MNTFTKRIAFCLWIGLIFSSMSVNAQTWDEIVNDRDTYLSGEGYGSNIDEADQQALSVLSGKISTVVASSFDILEDEITKNGKIDESTYISSKVNTYSYATLTNTERIVEPDDTETRVLRYIKRTEVDKIFAGRKLKVTELVSNGEKAEKLNKVDDALKYYYWAFTLLKTLQYPDLVKYTDMKGKDQLLATWLPVKIDAIFDDIQAYVTRLDDDRVELSFMFRGNPVVGMGYTYFDGRNYSKIYEVKDGRGEVELTNGEAPESLQLYVEYAYRDDAKIYCPEVKDVQSVVKSHSLRKASLKVPLVETKPSEQIQLSEKQKNKKKIPYSEMDDDAAYRNKVDEFIAAIRRKDYHSIDGLFTPNGLNMYNQLLKYGTARIYGEPQYKILRRDNEVVARSIPMSFSFKQGVRKSIVEDVVLSFDAEGKIHWISFALDAPAANDLLTKGAWPESARTTLLEFLEDYKTAYCLERLDYLQQVFSDDAIIIVGHVLKKMEKVNEKDMITYRENKIVKKTQYTKAEYLKHLSACFNKNECISVHFADNDVVKAGKGDETYGIQIKQDYYSTTYGDSGYLFLLVDLNNPDEPTIMVRVWQEEPDPNFGLASMKDFK